MNSEPLEEEIPVEYDDLALEVQEALNIYSKLRDEWDTMNGIYLGKSLHGFIDILNILEVPDKDRKTVLDLIQIIDRCKIKLLEEKRPKPTKTPK